MLPVLPLVIAGATEAIRAGVGLSQIKAGKEIDAKSTRPVDYITNSDKSALMMAKMFAGIRELPGANTINENLDAAGANAIRESKAGGNVDVATISKGIMDAKENLGVQTASMIDNNNKILMGALGRFGALEKGVFDYNQKQKYAEDMQMASTLRNSGITNSFNAASNVATGAIGAYNTSLSAKAYQSVIDMYKDNMTTPTTEKAGELSVVPQPSVPPLADAITQTSAADDNPMVQNTFDMLMSNPALYLRNETQTMLKTAALPKFPMPMMPRIKL